MRIVLDSHSEVCHVWAQQTQDEGRSGNMFFKGKTIYSYGRHFPIARFVDENTVLFTSKDYSVSMSKHKSYVRRAIRSGVKVFCVPDINAFDENTHKANLEYLLSMMNETAETAVRSRKYTESLLRYSLEYLTTAREYRDYFNIDYLLPDNPPKMEEVKEKIKQQAKAESERKAALREKQKGDRIFFESNILPLWRKGEVFEKDGIKANMWYAFGLYDHEFLRIKKENGTKAIVETSKDVSVLVKYDKKVLPFVDEICRACLDCIENKAEKTYNLKINEYYTLKRIDENGLFM